MRAEKLERVTREAEAYRNETAPCGALPVEAFTFAGVSGGGCPRV